MSIASEITALQTDKTNIKAAIIAKGGTSSSESGFDDFATDIGTIPDSDGMLRTFLSVRPTWKTVFDSTSSTIFEGDSYTFPTPTIATDCEAFLNRAPLAFKCRELKFNFAAGTSYYMNTFMANWGSSGIVEKVTFLNGLKMSAMRLVFQGMQCLKEISGELDFSAITTSSNNTLWYTCSNLETVTIKQNSMNVPVNGGNNDSQRPNFNNASLVSIANGLNESVTGQSFQFTSAQKATVQTLMGTVAMDETSTYHIFTQDDSGTVTLADFITDTKGWTLA